MMKRTLFTLLLLAGALTLHEAFKPDVLFIVIDDLNDWTTLFDKSNPIKTPNMERLAARGTFFSNAHCAAPACGPSRTAVLSGFAPTTSGAYENAPQVYRKTMPDDISLPDWFRRNGYTSWGGGKIFHNGGGNDESDRSFDAFFPLGSEPKAKAAQLKLPDWADFGEVNEELADVRTVAAAGAFLKSKTDTPRFTAVGLYKPHLPHYAPKQNVDNYPIAKVVMPSMPGDDFSDIPGPGKIMAHREYDRVEAMNGRKPGSAGSPEHLVQSYQASADFADEMVGRVLDALDASGRAGNTIIVLWGDNGYHLGDKESISKFTLWEKASHVPFIIVAPGVSKPGSRCEAPVSLVNIFPTLTELANLPAKPRVDGSSLVPLLRDPNAVWDNPAVITMGRGNHAVRTADWRYIRYHDGSEELYDARKDPWNNANLAAKPELGPVLATLRAALPKSEIAVPAVFGNTYKAPGHEADLRAPNPAGPRKPNGAEKDRDPGEAPDGVLPDGAASRAMPAISRKTPVTPDLHLNFHLMHPGQKANPADPNAGLFVDGTCHLHYIYNPGGKPGEFAFAHVASKDMLHWEWLPTNLNKAFTGHGMFSGTAFLTREGKPAVIYHGQGSEANQVALANDRALTEWEKPVAVKPSNPKGLDISKVINWDPDCFRVGDAYYAIFGNRIGQVEEVPYLAKSTDLKNWEYVGPFMSRELPDVLAVEDISCANFFQMGTKWMLLCISHNLGCRYYLGEWDAKREQFVPESHHRMSWPLDWHPLDERSRLNVFAPESLLTPDGRRVMWGWLFELPGGVQSLPRELELPNDGLLRIKPLRELNTLRAEGKTLTNIPLPSGLKRGDKEYHHVADLPGDAVEIRAVFDRAKAEHARFGFNLFANKPDGSGFPIRIQPDSRTIRVGASEAPFAVADLPAGEDVEIRIFIDKYLVEVFVNDRQAVVGWHDDWRGKTKLHAYSYIAPTEIKQLAIWPLKSTNAGFLKALESGVVR